MSIAMRLSNLQSSGPFMSLELLPRPRQRIELGHRGEDRSIFARGAVKAALWLADKPAGRYDMAEVLGF